MYKVAFSAAIETDKFKKKNQERTSRGRCVQPSRKRLENGYIAEEAFTRKRVLGKATMARELKRKAANGPWRPDIDLDSEG